MKNYNYNFVETERGFFDFIKIGNNSEKLIIIPGLSDGLVEPTKLSSKNFQKSMYKMYNAFEDNYEIYVISRKRNLEKGISIEDMADDYFSLFNLLDFDKINLMGVSQGGMISQYLAAKYSKMIKKLILVVTTPTSKYYTANLVKKWKRFAEENEVKKLMKDTILKTYSENKIIKMKLLMPLITMAFTKISNERFTRQAEAIINFDATHVLNIIKAPTLIASGEMDKICGPNSGYILNKKIQNSQLEIFEGQSHAIFEEKKNKFNKLVLDFLRR
ncbi:MAG: alpha/beta fold hydrolase [Thermotogota bacterium]